MEILKAICILLLLFVLGLCFELLFHPKADLKSCVYHLKADFCTVVKALVTKEESRFIFDGKFEDKLRNIVEPYGAVGMDIDILQNYIAKPPFIGVQFVPNRQLNMQDLQRVTDLLKIAFRHQLNIETKFWRNFACYESGPEYVRIYLYYEELEKDKEHFEQRYSILVKEQVGLDFGCLRDNDLDKELNAI